MSIKENPWRVEEDESLRQLVELYGKNSWNRVHSGVKEQCPGFNKSSKQCRERWTLHLDPSLNKGPWVETETQTLFKLHQKYGNQWSRISREFPGRTDTAIKNFFCSAVCRALKNYNRDQRNGTRILRTTKALIRDRDITRTLGLSHEPTVTAEEPQVDPCRREDEDSVVTPKYWGDLQFQYFQRLFYLPFPGYQQTNWYSGYQ